MLPPSVPSRPWADCPAPLLRRIVGVLTDVDDTLTSDGELDPAARQALARLRAAGLPVFAVTGRPVGWSRPFAADWPVDAIVAENGAVALTATPQGLAVDYLQDAATRATNARRLREVAARIVREVPGATLAQDSAGRETDIAIDHSEFTTLPAEAIEQVVRLMREAGMQATVSSIHVNGWYGDHDKPAGARWIVRSRLGRDLDAERDRWLYVGDSTNDQAMFRLLPLSVGVANLLDFADRLTAWPAWITQRARGEGFAEVVARVLEARE